MNSVFRIREVNVAGLGNSQSIKRRSVRAFDRLDDRHRFGVNYAKGASVFGKNVFTVRAEFQVDRPAMKRNCLTSRLDHLSGWQQRLVNFLFGEWLLPDAGRDD